MGNNERISSLTKYAEELKHRLASEIPAKHKKATHVFLDFLKRELKKTEATITKLKG